MSVPALNIAEIGTKGPKIGVPGDVGDHRPHDGEDRPQPVDDADRLQAARNAQRGLFGDFG